MCLCGKCRVGVCACVGSVECVYVPVGSVYCLFAGVALSVHYIITVSQSYREVERQMAELQSKQGDAENERKLKKKVCPHLQHHHQCWGSTTTSAGAAPPPVLGQHHHQCWGSTTTSAGAAPSPVLGHTILHVLYTYSTLSEN